MQQLEQYREEAAKGLFKMVALLREMSIDEIKEVHAMAFEGNPAGRESHGIPKQSGCRYHCRQDERRCC